jgi:nucleotide-binding universal stress UspA family protein
MKHYRIVAALDLTEYSDIVLEHALDQAARHDRPELHAVFVRERAHRKRAPEELHQHLASVVYPALQTWNRSGTWRARLYVRTGKVDHEIAALAQDLLADLVVVGQFGLHTPRSAASSTSARVLVGAPCPTLVVSMPRAHQASPICGACAAARDDSFGDRWFCTEHVAT